MTTTDTRTYGRTAPCQRTACAERDPHVGGLHLDPTSELYDGPDTMLRALPYNVRDKALALLHASRKEGPWDQRLVDVALDAMGREIRRLGEQIAHVQVDADHKVIDASRKALDCEHHGKTIQGLEEQLTHFEQAERRAEKGRLALLSGIHVFQDLVSGCDAKALAGEPLPEVGAVIEFIRKTCKKVSAAHMRAWSK